MIRLKIQYNQNRTIGNIEKRILNKQKLMSMSQSKLMVQLLKQQRVHQKVPFNEQKIEDLYATISKLQPKNLMLVEFLTLMIEKNLIKNSQKIETFVDMYQEIKDKKLDQEYNSFSIIYNRSPNATSYLNNSMGQCTAIINSSNMMTSAQGSQKQEQKFNKKKFLKLLKDVAKLLFPGDQRGYESTLYLKLMVSEQEQNRMKVDDNLKKFLNEQIILEMAKYNKELESLFQVYMPENYNNKLGFSWNQIRLLEKKLPIVCLLRILFQAQICPQLLTQIQFLEIVSKMIPPVNSNHKEVIFYYSETFNNYMREHIFNEEIKLLQGDIGLSYLEFQLLLIRIATEVCKDPKQQIVRAIEKLMAQVDITQLIKFKKQQPRTTKLQSVVFAHLKNLQKSTPLPSAANKFLKKNTDFKKQNQQLSNLLDDKDSQSKNTNTPAQEIPFKKLQHQSILITKDDLMKIKKNLDDELGPVPEQPTAQKENQGYFNVNEKFTVIGEQLPKLQVFINFRQQKNKPVSKPNHNDKKEYPPLGFKPVEIPKLQPLKKTSLLLNRKKKLRINSQHSVILSEVFYPTSFSDPTAIQLKQEQQIYIETTYIHLGQRMYEEAYLNFQKAQRLIKCKKSGSSKQNSVLDKKAAMMLEFYLEVLEAQIFQAAGKDEAALIHYNNAKQISFNFQIQELAAKAYTYIGLSSTLYHLQQYEFALRCLLKAKQIYCDCVQTQSIENAILMNNIGSCYMMLNRNQEAAKYFKLSHQIFDLKVGRFDERSLVVQQNISKNKKAFIEQMPSFKTMWKTYVHKNTALTAAKTIKKPVK